MASSTTLLIDSCILIDYARNYEPSIKYLERLEEAPAISAATVTEVLSGAHRDGERQMFEALFERWFIVSIDYQVAACAAAFCRTYRRSHSVEPMDALIAASADRIGARVVSRNRKHFPMLTNLVVPYT